MKLCKNGVVVVLMDKAHIDAYLSSGWKPLQETTAPITPTTKKLETVKIQKQ